VREREREREREKRRERERGGRGGGERGREEYQRWYMDVRMERGEEKEMGTEYEQ